MTADSDNQPNELAQVEVVRTTTPRNKRRTGQALADAFGQIASLVCGGLIVTWSVFNLSWNFLQFWQDSTGENNWLIGVCMVVATCIFPLIAGFWLLFSSVNNKSIRQKK